MRKMIDLFKGCIVYMWIFLKNNLICIFDLKIWLRVKNKVCIVILWIKFDMCEYLCVGG